MLKSLFAASGVVRARGESGPPGATATVPAEAAGGSAAGGGGGTRHQTFAVTARLPFPADVGRGDNLLRLLAAGAAGPPASAAGSGSAQASPAVSPAPRLPPGSTEPMRAMPISFWRWVSLPPGGAGGDPASNPLAVVPLGHVAAEPVLSQLPPEGEMEMAEERWLEATRALGQWAPLRDHAFRTGDDVLAADSTARRIALGIVESFAHARGTVSA
jgi:hypothetical protein